MRSHLDNCRIQLEHIAREAAYVECMKDVLPTLNFCFQVLEGFESLEDYDTSSVSNTNTGLTSPIMAMQYMVMEKKEIMELIWEAQDGR